MSAFPFAWRRPGLTVAWGGVVVSLALAPLLANAPLWVLVIPWTLSAVVLGLPHGAADPFVPFRLNDTALRPGPVAVFCVAYLALGAVYLGLWAVLPAAAAIGFLLLTWAHWGQGDLYALRAMGWDLHLGGRAHLTLALVVRGALPMAVPLAAFPEV
ncbi:Brp/Blh family beta-carotene 15,15'-dioxygenase, partial [Rubrivirga sp.]|uniref:Brp/Blh family beta-carotene 15,15'-dioxygenase n=1 Tax=Rubrivirga sp. TaxID=1885344 RepID=UPI003C741B5C